MAGYSSTAGTYSLLPTALARQAAKSSGRWCWESGRSARIQTVLQRGGGSVYRRCRGSGYGERMLLNIQNTGYVLPYYRSSSRGIRVNKIVLQVERRNIVHDIALMLSLIHI